MENNQLLLSICIPTNGIVEWVVPVIESIYSQGVDNSLFEVVVTDNGGKPEFGEVMKRYEYENFRYYKTSSQGFTNQIDAFEKCNGVFCKMLNHRSTMIPGSIKALIDLVRKYMDEKPIIYCAEGRIKGDVIIECDNTDEFVNKLGFWVSWSAGTGAWNCDIRNVRFSNPSKMFPHTLFLFDLRKESKYVIWNEKYEVMANDRGKGGYDVFKAFSVDLLDIINRLRLEERVSASTFIAFKRKLYGFLNSLYLSEVLMKSQRKFIIKDIGRSMCVYYGRWYYNKMVIMSYIMLPFKFIRQMIN